MCCWGLSFGTKHPQKHIIDLEFQPLCQQDNNFLKLLLHLLFLRKSDMKIIVARHYIRLPSWLVIKKFVEIVLKNRLPKSDAYSRGFFCMCRDNFLNVQWSQTCMPYIVWVEFRWMYLWGIIIMRSSSCTRIIQK